MPVRSESELVPRYTVPRYTPTRLAGIAGVLGGILPAAALAILPIWRFPGTNSSAAEATAFALQNQTRFGLQ